MSTQQETRLVPVKEKIANVRTLLEKAKAQIALALPRHFDPDRMLRIAMTSIQKNPKLLECTPQSLIGAIIQSAQLGLEPDGVLGHAYLVPYGKVCQFIPGYKGLVQLARRSGEVSTLTAEGVYEEDVFHYELGLNPILQHIPTDKDDRGRFVAAYAVCKLKDGGTQFSVMRKSAIDKIRERSPAGNSGPWVTDYEEMAKKTAIRRLCKLLPCSVELQKAIALDERAEVGLPQDIEFEDIQSDAAPESKLDKIVNHAKRIKAPTAGEHIDVAPEPAIETCDKSDFDRLEILGTECGVFPKRWRKHIEETLGISVWDALPKDRLHEVQAWIQAQVK